MKTQPDQWSGYYSGTNQEVELLKVFSYSDRIRYYWNDSKDPKDLIKGHVQRCVGRYFEAAGLSENNSVLKC